jgi:hypothetical protein
MRTNPRLWIPYTYYSVKSITASEPGTSTDVGLTVTATLGVCPDFRRWGHTIPGSRGLRCRNADTGRDHQVVHFPTRRRCVAFGEADFQLAEHPVQLLVELGQV